MRIVLTFVVLLASATAVAAAEKHRPPLPVKVIEEPFRLSSDRPQRMTDRTCRTELGPALPEGKIFVADYVSIQVSVANAPPGLEGAVRALTGFLTTEDIPSLGKLERVGDLFVLGEQTALLMTNPTEDAMPLALAAEFDASFPEPVDVSCRGRIDGHLIDGGKLLQTPQ